MRIILLAVLLVVLALAGAFFFRHETTYKWIGTGVFLKRVDHKVLIREVLPNSPAQQEGIQVGDQIIQVDDKNVTDLRVPEVLELLRGTLNSTVKVTVLRHGTPDPLTFTIVRKEVEGDGAVKTTN